MCYEFVMMILRALINFFHSEIKVFFNTLLMIILKKQSFLLFFPKDTISELVLRSYFTSQVLNICKTEIGNKVYIINHSKSNHRIRTQMRHRCCEHQDSHVRFRDAGQRLAIKTIGVFFSRTQYQ